MRSLLKPPDDIRLITYVDDITIATSGPHVDELPDKINKYLAELSEWLEKRRLVLFTKKSTTTFFTNGPKKSAQIPKSLSKTKKSQSTRSFDNIMMFTQHAKIAREKDQSRNNILKKFANTTWGCSKENLTASYKQLEDLSSTTRLQSGP